MCVCVCVRVSVGVFAYSKPVHVHVDVTTLVQCIIPRVEALTSLSVSKMASGLILMMISEAAIAPSLAARWITVLPR